MILAFATQGSGGDDEARLRALLSDLPSEIFSFDHKNKWRSFLKLLELCRKQPPLLLVMEGTGSAGGLALLIARWRYGIPYVVSSGDAVGPFLSAKFRWGRAAFILYEWLLYWASAGFIGWSPYLTGRALTMGARRAMTIPGWAPYEERTETQATTRARIRRELGIPDDAIVFGIAGSLTWSPRFAYCYGRELVEAFRRTQSPKVHVLIVGDGDGMEQLKQLAGDALGHRVILTGRVPRQRVPEYLDAMDVGSLPQSVDAVGSFRYTTKISEYLASDLPIVATSIPASYDLDCGYIWRLPGNAPWDSQFVEALADLMNRVTPEEIHRHRVCIARLPKLFDKEAQISQTRQFLTDLLKSPNNSTAGQARGRSAGPKAIPSIQTD